MAILAILGACGTGAGDNTVCYEDGPRCDFGYIAAVDVYSKRGCSSAIGNSWCGVDAQALAECLATAQLCIDENASRETIQGALAASVCAAEYAQWDGCFGNGEAGDGHGDDDDWDD